MARQFYQHLAFIILATITAWLWTQSPQLSFYNLQLIAILILAYFSRQLAQKRRRVLLDGIDGLIFTLVILLLVFTSGGGQSPLFFLLYFLLFGLSFAWEPRLTFGFSFFLAFFLLFISPQASGWKFWLNPLSLLLVAPLSLYFGRQYLENLRQQRRLKLYQHKWSRDERHLSRQETAILFWLSTNFRPAMIEILDKLSLLLSDLSKNEEQRSWLKRIRRLASRLLRDSRQLEHQVDLETDGDD